VSPAMTDGGGGATGVAFSTVRFPSNDVDRTRDGYLEVIEMATLTGTTFSAVAQDVTGVPHDCAAVQSATFAPPLADLGAPSGGLKGTLTLINVASGMDFTVNADALAELVTKPVYTAPPLLLPDFTIPEITPMSVITTPTHVYRLEWRSGLDAVSSVLMRNALINEYVLDKATASSSDWVMTFPTRFALVDGAAAQAPFGGSSASGIGCEMLQATYFNREAAGASSVGAQFPEPPPGPPPLANCNASTVWKVATFTVLPSPPSVFGSGDGTGGGGLSSPFHDGWAVMAFNGPGSTHGLVSLASSSSIDLRTGAVTTGSMRILGLPVTGFFARTFLNGLLTCSGGACQGAYGSAFPHRSLRSISLVR